MIMIITLLCRRKIYNDQFKMRALIDIVNEFPLCPTLMLQVHLRSKSKWNWWMIYLLGSPLERLHLNEWLRFNGTWSDAATVGESCLSRLEISHLRLFDSSTCERIPLIIIPASHGRARECHGTFTPCMAPAEAHSSCSREKYIVKFPGTLAESLLFFRNVHCPLGPKVQALSFGFS